MNSLKLSILYLFDFSDFSALIQLLYFEIVYHTILTQNSLPSTCGELGHLHRNVRVVPGFPVHLSTLLHHLVVALHVVGINYAGQHEPQSQLKLVVNLRCRCCLEHGKRRFQTPNEFSIFTHVLDRCTLYFSSALVECRRTSQKKWP